MITFLKRVIAGFRSLFRQRQREHDLDAELREFLETAVEQKTGLGMSRQPALSWKGVTG